MPAIGDPAPAFALDSTSGQRVLSKQLLGKKVVLYFYPKDDTPGCTREACDFRDNLARLGAADAVVLGVSSDNIASHAKFRAKYSLPFDLLADPGNVIAKKYGAYGEKTLYGKKVTGTIRSTFVIDEEGKLMAKWSPVRVDGHVDKVLAALAPAEATLAAAKGEVPMNAPKKASTKNRTFNGPTQHRAGRRAGRAAQARASQVGRGYRQASRNQGKRDPSGKK